MGFGGISIAQLSIILVIVFLIFGTKRLRQAGGDIGGMFRGIREGFKAARETTDELAPDVRAAIEDVKQLHSQGARFTNDVRYPVRSYEDRE